MRINSVPDANPFVIIKICYMHNQWYDISCATLYYAKRIEILRYSYLASLARIIFKISTDNFPNRTKHLGFLIE